MLGLIHSVWSPVTTPSRPNGVLNHGTPAYGYGPYFVVGDQHPQIGGRASHPLVEPLARRLDRRVLGFARLRARSSTPTALASNVRLGTRRPSRSQRMAIASETGAAARGRTRTAPGSASARAAPRPNRSPPTASRRRGRGSRAGSPCRSVRSRSARRASRGMPRTSKMSAKSASNSNESDASSAPWL